ncbi:MAG: phosphatidylglycerophosphatase A [Deltaproteobacteria bacterium]|nr:phosphatidylglycerophosphatase A [Deltaproteobacteria bacterium]
MNESAFHHRFSIFLATGFYSGYCPLAPGTAGTAVGILFFWCFSHLSPFLYLLTLGAFVFLAAWLAGEAEKILQTKDSPHIVIDEIAGFLITMTSIPCTWVTVGAGFILFRFFDILKPFPARWIDKNASGGWGIVLDDVVAGAYAAIVLHGVLLWR